ncbi:hypothetical protein YPPY102_0674, partial [Yersinia pestis PY-102]
MRVACSSLWALFSQTKVES